MGAAPGKSDELGRTWYYPVHNPTHLWPQNGRTNPRSVNVQKHTVFLADQRPLPAGGSSWRAVAKAEQNSPSNHVFSSGAPIESLLPPGWSSGPPTLRPPL